MSEPNTAAEQILSNEFEAAIIAIRGVEEQISSINVDENSDVIASSNLAVARALVLVATVIDHRGTDIIEKLQDLNEAIELVGRTIDRKVIPS